MRRSFFSTAAWCMAVALAACGGRDEIPVPGDVRCDPVAQIGCDDGEKCTWIYVNENPVLGRTDCMPDGTRALGESCVIGAVHEADDCQAGGYCNGGVCTQICSRAPDSCPSSDACTFFAEVFDDQDGNVGACRPLCDPVAQTCPAGEACYLRDWQGRGTCGTVPQAAAGYTQDEICYGPSEAACYSNGCARGFDTFQVRWDGFETGVCMQFCSPAVVGLDAVNGDKLDDLRGDAGGIRCGDYDESAGELANTECRFFNALVGPRNGSGLPDTLGICLSESFRAQLGMGSCTEHQLGAAATQENVQNGTYVVGCEPLSDITGTASRALPGELERRQELVFHALVEETERMSVP